MRTFGRFPDLAMAETFEWLLEETTEFVADPGEDPVVARARALLALVHASRQARDLVGDRVNVGTVLAAEIRITTACGDQDACVYRSLPNPLALLLIGSQRCRAGDRVGIVIQRAGMDPSERSSLWPFGLPVAERLTRPGPPPGS